MIHISLSALFGTPHIAGFAFEKDASGVLEVTSTLILLPSDTFPLFRYSFHDIGFEAFRTLNLMLDPFEFMTETVDLIFDVEVVLKLPSS